ncbi:MAG: ATP-binding protein, partial [Enterobacter hormaechei]|nr:ATP-binding protein [Enterobacter hormaechei]
ALRQSQKIEAVGQLTGGIAHDFNNILTVISGNVEHAMLLNERAGEAGAMVSRALDNALKGVGRAASLTQRLLAFARRQPLHSQAANLHERLLDMHDMLQRALGELVQLEIRSAEDIWCVEIDISQLEASVLNLAVNARDAMPHGGRLVIEVDNSHLDHDYAALFPDAAPGQYVMLRVRDNGHGMDAATLARVFEPFFTTKQTGSGSGLGLSMVYGFVRQSGGRVEIESAPGQGTTVRLQLPRSTLPAFSDDAALATTAPAESELLVLVLEDEAGVRQTLCEQLHQLGYLTLEAENGEQALNMLDASPDIGMFITDLMLPGGLSGAEVIGHVRSHYPQLPVLLISGQDLRPAHNPQLPDVQLLRKPFTRAQLAQALRKVMAGTGSEPG